MRYLIGLLLALTPVITFGAYDLELADYIGQRAKAHGLNPAKIVSVAICESNINPKAYNPDNGAKSRGLWQISKLWHPEVSDEVAYDAIESTEWSLKRMVAGFFREWSCWDK